MNQLKQTIQLEAHTALTNFIDCKLFTDLHEKYKTVSGDISPDQEWRLRELINDTSQLIALQVYQNLPSLLQAFIASVREVSPQVAAKLLPYDINDDRVTKVLVYHDAVYISLLNDGSYELLLEQDALRSHDLYELECKLFDYYNREVIEPQNKFIEFRESRRIVDADTDEAKEYVGDEHELENVAKVYFYKGHCYILRLEDGRYELLIYNEDHCGTELEPLEKKLYEFALGEGYLEQKG